MNDEELIAAAIETNYKLAFDIECYQNYFLVVFKSIPTGKILVFEKTLEKQFDILKLAWVARNFCLIGFNSKNYDLPILTLALSGCTCAELKAASDKIILQDFPAYKITKGYDELTVNHIDLIEVAPGFTSLKMLGARMHTKLIQDLPYEPDSIIDAEAREQLRSYCVNDVTITAELFSTLEERINLRCAMSTQYDIDLRSKSDAQIAELIVTKEVERLNGSKVIKQEIPSDSKFKYAAPDWIKFKTPQLNLLLERIQTTVFSLSASGSIALPPTIELLTVQLGKGVYRIGIGGIHSSEECTAHRADENTLLLDRDVRSYYPEIMMHCQLFPPQMGPKFLDVFGSILKRRLEAKDSGDKTTAEVLKIVVNGSFGKLGSKFSTLYAPDLFIQVTITGQLALLMLIEALEENGVPVVSANTDGIVLACPKDRHDVAEQLVAEWEQKTGFVTEETRYSALYSRDVNNYIAVKMNGDVKLKGAYAPAALAKSPDSQIVIDAVVSHLVKGTDVAETIRQCTDIRKFVMVRQARSGAVKDGYYLGKTVRWYYAQNESGTINSKDRGATVAGSKGGQPVQRLPDAFPDNVDFESYTQKAIGVLNDLGVTNTVKVASVKRVTNTVSTKESTVPISLDLFGEPIVGPIDLNREMLEGAIAKRLLNISAESLAAMFYSEIDAIVDFARLCRGDKACQKLSLLFNPHRLDTRTINATGASIIEAFKDPSFAKGVARVLAWTENPKISTRELMYQSLQKGINSIQYVNEFPPHVARDLYQSFSAQRILDPCAGWGGRMIGAASCGSFYHGFEPSTKSFAGLQQLGTFLKSFNTGFDFIVENLPFEDSVLTEQYDIAFTSPPYFDTEKYANEPTQAAIRYPSFEAFTNGFYLPMVRKAIKHSKNGLIINIGSRRYPMRKVLSDEFGENVRELQKFLAAGGGLRSEDKEGEVFLHITHDGRIVKDVAPPVCELEEIVEEEVVDSLF